MLIHYLNSQFGALDYACVTFPPGLGWVAEIVSYLLPLRTTFQQLEFQQVGFLKLDQLYRYLKFKYLLPHLMNWDIISKGTGKIIVEFFSADIELRVWKSVLMQHTPQFWLLAHLEISKLQSSWALCYCAWGLSQGPTGLLLPLSRDHLGVNVFCWIWSF